MAAFSVFLLSEFLLDWQLDLESCPDLGSAFWQEFFIGGVVQFHIRECTILSFGVRPRPSITEFSAFHILVWHH